MKAEVELEKLRAAVRDFTARSEALTAEVEKKKSEAGSALLDGQNTAHIEKELAALTAKLTVLQSGRSEALRRLPEAEAAAKAEKRKLALEWLDEIRPQLDRMAGELSETLGKANTEAGEIEKLIQEARTLNNQQGVPLTALGGWIHCTLEQLTRMINFIQEEIRRFRGKS